MTELSSHYAVLEGKVEIENDDSYGSLVTSNQNDRHPFHRWFRMKEAFSFDFVDRVVKDVGLSGQDSLNVLDPFAGSGTTAVSVGMMDRDWSAFGVECNPFLHLLAASKQEAMKQRPTDILATMSEVMALSRARLESGERFYRPALSTFRRVEYFDRNSLRQLLSIVAVLDEIAAPGANLTIDLLRIAAAGTVEPISSLRRDGRALRFDPAKIRRQTLDEFRRRCECISEDVEGFQGTITGTQLRGDVREGKTLHDLKNIKFDLSIFSPPYPNNIDYTEVYKLEAWLLGFYNDTENFRSQRLSTVHSHPSIKRSTPSSSAEGPYNEFLKPILDDVPEGRYAADLRSMIIGYATDMGAVFSSLKKRLADGGHVVFAVGNSAHGPKGDSLVVAADLVLIETARCQGYEIERLVVARNLHRRPIESDLLRESVCFLRAPTRGSQ